MKFGTSSSLLKSFQNNFNKNLKNYSDEPRPTYEPQKKIANKPIAKVPTTVPTSHKGIRPVVPVLDINKKMVSLFII